MPQRAFFQMKNSSEKGGPLNFQGSSLGRRLCQGLAGNGVGEDLAR